LKGSVFHSCSGKTKPEIWRSRKYKEKGGHRRGREVVLRVWGVYHFPFAKLFEDLWTLDFKGGEERERGEGR